MNCYVLFSTIPVWTTGYFISLIHITYYHIIKCTKITCYRHAMNTIIKSMIMIWYTLLLTIPRTGHVMWPRLIPSLLMPWLHVFARSSVAMILIIKDGQVFIFCEKEFLLPMPFQFWGRMLTYIPQVLDMSWYNITWYCIQYDKDKVKLFVIRLWTNKKRGTCKRRSIAHPWGWAMERLLQVPRRYMTSRYHECTV